MTVLDADSVLCISMAHRCFSDCQSVDMREKYAMIFHSRPPKGHKSTSLAEGAFCAHTETQSQKYQMEKKGTDKLVQIGI